LIYLLKNVEMAQLKYLIIHCSDTPPNFDVTGDHIREWHLIGRKWSKVGYSDLIKLDGTIENLNEYNDDNWIDANEITNGAKGFNGVSRHVCIAGGKDDNFKSVFGSFELVLTDAQFVALQEYIKAFLGKHPKCKVLGHYQVNKHKCCPGFNIPEYLRYINIPEKYIYNGLV